MAERMGDRLTHLHLTDGSGSTKDEHLVPGRGNQPCAEVCQLLADGGFARTGGGRAGGQHAAVPHPARAHRPARRVAAVRPPAPGADGHGRGLTAEPALREHPEPALH